MIKKCIALKDHIENEQKIRESTCNGGKNDVKQKTIDKSDRS